MGGGTEAGEHPGIFMLLQTMDLPFPRAPTGLGGCGVKVTAGCPWVGCSGASGLLFKAEMGAWAWM